MLWTNGHACNGLLLFVSGWVRQGVCVGVNAVVDTVTENLMA